MDPPGLVDIPEHELRRAIAALTGRPSAGPWRSTALRHHAVASATGGLWRVTGQDWSVVLKLVVAGRQGHPRWRSGSEPGHWYYWRREVCAYESGLLGSWLGGLRAPTCLLVATRAEDEVALWLEDAGELGAATHWALDRYRLAARHLGRAQGEFLTTRPLPDDAWLSRRWLRDYLAHHGDDLWLLDATAVWARQDVRRRVPAVMRRGLRRLRDDQARFVDALSRLPATVCHLDLHPANLFDEDGGGTVLVDWSFVGIGAMGEDPGNLVPDAVFDFHVAPDRIDALFDAVHHGYLEGLRDAGWQEDAELVRLGLCAGAAAKYAWIGAAVLRAVVDDQPLLNGRDIDDALRWWLPAIDYVLHRADDLRRLLGA